MKMIYKNLPVLMMVIMICLVSCDDFMDTHKQFVEGGEKVYAPKPGSVSFLPGINRVKFQSWILNSPNVKSVDIFWNSGQDSLIIPVTPSSGLDSVEAILSLPVEKSYTFSVRHTDTYGHHSLSVSGFSTSYGEVYRSALRNRIVREIAITGSNANISWFTAEENLVRSEVHYVDVNDDPIIVRVSPDELSTVCPSPKTSTTFEYRSLFLPETSAIDTFYLEWEQLFPVIQFDKTAWSVISCSDEEVSDGGGKDVLIDGILTNYWHSKWTSPVGQLPHWAIIDMVSPQRITKIETYRRPNNTNTKSVQYLVSNDSDPNAQSWLKIMEGTFVSGNLLTLNAPENNITGRYLKIFLPNSNVAQGYTSVSEINVYGK
ncbi:MAG: discoidin domain-containing protein [Prevotellaceae bacterium]|jgi:hypothetical protein|nr:discoidin domain-containing protein [Prevotellaceae bacterium]